MSEFDDPQLERLLGGAGGAFPDVNTAYAQVTGRVRHIKRRRAMVASTAACMLLAAGAAFAIGRGDDRTNLSPAGGVDGTETTDTEHETESTPVTDSTNGSQPTASTDASGSGTGSGSGSDTGSSGPSTSANTTAPTTPVNIGEQTYTCAGGTIKLKVVNGLMVLVSVQAADGFTEDSSTVRTDRIEFRWRSDTDDQRIRVDLVNGVLVRQS